MATVFRLVGFALTFAAAIASAQDPPPPQAGLRPLPINLPTALQLANANAVDVAAAAERVRIAAAQLEQARALWLPTVTVGGDYNRHDGRIQNADGTLIDAGRNGLMFGAGTGIGSAGVLSVTDAIF